MSRLAVLECNSQGETNHVVSRIEPACDLQSPSSSRGASANTDAELLRPYIVTRDSVRAGANKCSPPCCFRWRHMPPGKVVLCLASWSVVCSVPVAWSTTLCIVALELDQNKTSHGALHGMLTLIVIRFLPLDESAHSLRDTMASNPALRMFLCSLLVP